ncbi:flagellar filament capping protein FliD [Salirhabdus sp. Marseille-P4669]|uniref:flagellar filament capping protein FliD n=1 Tax=Salirhabdus sp. Marseille-P4669 TaxID=2042310 RepID=UPI000C7A71A0|nr:flagellar filament capping protein FliD [Salirhabdus sp. Marseille-P4669]
MSDMRIGGLASGLDTDSIVKELMTAERMPLDKMQQDRTWLTWQRDAYREINSLLFDLDSLALNMKLSSTYNNKTVSSSNDSFATATATAAAANGTHTLSNVSVATAAYNISFQGNANTNLGVSGDKTAADYTKVDATKSLWSQKSNFGNSDFADVNGGIWETRTYENKDISVSKAGTNFKLEKGAIDSTSLTSIVVTDSEGVEKTYTVVSGEPSNANEVSLNAGTGELVFGEELTEGSTISGPSYDHYVVSFSIKTYDQKGNVIEDNADESDGYQFEFDGTKSLNQIMSEISNSRVGVSAFYDGFSDKVSFQRKETGDLNVNGQEMEFSGSFLTDVLGMDSSQELNGTNATFTLDGLQTQRTSNSFTISGVSYTLKDNFTGSTTISVENNTEASFEKVKEFVDKYNEIIEKVNGKLTEGRYRDYPPLTDAQKEGMSDKEIELWEERAKSGLLKGDSILSSAMSDLRMAWYSRVETNGAYTHLSEIGIETTANFMAGGKLEIDEAKLKKALSTDPDAVYKLFSNSEEGSSRGLINRVEDSIEKAMGNIESKAGKSTSTLQQYTMGKRLDDLNDRIDNFQDRLVTIENRYWSQFTAMEKAIQQMNSQMSYLMNMFG